MFTDVHAALAFVKNRTRREAARQLHRMNGRTLAVPHSLGAAAVIDRWHNQPPTILRRIEFGWLHREATPDGLPRNSAS
jgi:hypothetical protein